MPKAAGKPHKAAKAPKTAVHSARKQPKHKQGAPVAAKGNWTKTQPEKREVFKGVDKFAILPTGDVAVGDAFAILMNFALSGYTFRDMRVGKMFDIFDRFHFKKFEVRLTPRVPSTMSSFGLALAYDSDASDETPSLDLTGLRVLAAQQAYIEGAAWEQLKLRVKPVDGAFYTLPGAPSSGVSDLRLYEQGQFYIVQLGAAPEPFSIDVTIDYEVEFWKRNLEVPPLPLTMSSPALVVHPDKQDLLRMVSPATVPAVQVLSTGVQASWGIASAYPQAAGSVDVTESSQVLKVPPGNYRLEYWQGTATNETGLVARLRWFASALSGVANGVRLYGSSFNNLALINGVSPFQHAFVEAFLEVTDSLGAIIALGTDIASLYMVMSTGTLRISPLSRPQKPATPSYSEEEVPDGRAPLYFPVRAPATYPDGPPSTTPVTSAAAADQPARWAPPTQNPPPHGR